MSHLSRGNAKSGCNMCRAGKPTGGNSSTPGRNEPPGQKEAQQTPSGLFVVLLQLFTLGCHPEGPSYPGATTKSSTALMSEPPSEWKNTQFPLCDGIVALGVLKEITGAQLGLRATAECVSHCCIVKRLVLFETCRCEQDAKSCCVSCIFHIIFHTIVPQ